MMVTLAATAIFASPMELLYMSNFCGYVCVSIYTEIKGDRDDIEVHKDLRTTVSF